MEPWYIPTIVPAPQGWLQQGSADPGDEFWYQPSFERLNLGYPDAQVFPGEYLHEGWLLSFNASQWTTYHASPEAAFNAYAEFVCDTPEDRNPDGTLMHIECACPMEDK